MHVYVYVCMCTVFVFVCMNEICIHEHTAYTAGRPARTLGKARCPPEGSLARLWHMCSALVVCHVHVDVLNMLGLQII